MPTLVSKTYYIPDAAIPPVDVNVPLGIAAHLVALEFGGYLNSGFLLVAVEQANLGGVTIHTSVINTPLDIQHSTGHDQNNGLAARAAIITKTGLSYNWPDEPWPDVSWADFDYIAGDFYHVLVP